MALHPPSFFATHQPRSPELQRATVHVPQEYQQDQHTSSNSWHEEVALLKQENQALKHRLKAAENIGGYSHLSEATGASMCPGGTIQAAAPLATDLLHVEAHLQSRMRVLEEEKREYSRQVLELERILSEQNRQHQAELEAQKLQYEEALQKAEVDNQELASEYSSFRQEKEERVSELEKEIVDTCQQYTDEVERLRARVAELEHSNTTMNSDFERRCQCHEEELSVIRKQLNQSETEKESLKIEMNEQISLLNSKLVNHHQKVQELESYLGGEIPTLHSNRANTSCGDPQGARQLHAMTWKEERESLYNIIREHEQNLQRSHSESKLLNIRLTSITEILSIQESDIAKHHQTSGQADISESRQVNAVKSLLTRWREKVFVLLVQQKLQQMETTRDKELARKNEESLIEQRQQLEREKELLSHSVADRTAQLQLQESNTKEAEVRCEQASSTIQELQVQLQDKKETLHRLTHGIQSMSELFSSYTSVYNQALTRMANYEHRLAFTSGRLNCLKATLSCHYAMVQGATKSAVDVVECGCQTTDEEIESRGADLTSFSREQLVQEVRSLNRERDSLVVQLRESTGSFQHQIQMLQEDCGSKLTMMDNRLKKALSDKCSLEDQLTKLQCEHNSVQEDKETLTERIQELETEMRDMQSSMDTRIESEVHKQQQRSGEELAEMEKLLNVARREHAKAVVQLQQLQRQLARDRDRALEAIELSKARVEHDLDSCQKKLQATQVERNLLLTTLRQEGLIAPTKRLSPKQQPIVSKEKHSTVTSREERGSDVLEETVSGESGAEDSSELDLSSKYSGVQDCSVNEDINESSPRAMPQLPTAQIQQETGQQDIRDVLKDLQMLSASLLGMEPANTISNQQ